MPLCVGLRDQALNEQINHALDGNSILITGASGLVGLNMMSLLASASSRGESSIEIYGVSRSGSLPDGFPEPGNVTMIARDLAEPKSYEDLPEADFVVHGATYGQPAKFTPRPTETILLNTLGTAELMKRARKSFLFLSTSELYSGLEEGPYLESQIGTTNTDHPRAGYIEAKRAGEAMTLAHRGATQLGKVARLSLAYGPGARFDDERVMYELISRALREKRVTLRGGAESVRSYIYIDDALRYLLSILLGGQTDIYNVGGTEAVTLESLAQKIADLLGLEFENQEKRESLELRSAPRDVRLDMSKSRELAGHFTHTSLSDGLVNTIAWMRQVVDTR